MSYKGNVVHSTTISKFPGKIRNKIPGFLSGPALSGILKNWDCHSKSGSGEARHAVHAILKVPQIRTGLLLAQSNSLKRETVLQCTSAGWAVRGWSLAQAAPVLPMPIAPLVGSLHCERWYTPPAFPADDVWAPSGRTLATPSASGCFYDSSKWVPGLSQWIQLLDVQAQDEAMGIIRVFSGILWCHLSHYLSENLSQTKLFFLHEASSICVPLRGADLMVS